MHKSEPRYAYKRSACKKHKDLFNHLRASMFKNRVPFPKFIKTSKTISQKVDLFGP